MRDIDLIAVHCSATKPSMDIGVSEIRDWHTSAPRNWSDIGYHDVIRRNGVRERGRPLERPGAHARGHNQRSIGICLVGGLNEHTGEAEANYTFAQYTALVNVLIEYTTEYPRAELKGHRDLSPDVDHDGIITPDEWMKECPCFDVRQFWSCVSVGQ